MGKNYSFDILYHESRISHTIENNPLTSFVQGVAD
jgi:hypothetical protein